MGEVHLLPVNPADPTSGFLSSIAHVGGDFTFKQTGGNLNELWPTLETVGGNVTLSASFYFQPHLPGVLNGLKTVGGVFTIDVDTYVCGFIRDPHGRGSTNFGWSRSLRG